MIYDIGRYDNKSNGLHDVWKQKIQASSLEEAKIKTKDLFIIPKREILGDWMTGKDKNSEDILYAYFSCSGRHHSGCFIVIYIKGY